MSGFDTDVDACLARLSLMRERPSWHALQRLFRAWVENVPYETTWIAMGEPWGIDRHEALGRIAYGGRGGYCYHVNGALSLVLENLGYDVTLHVGGVHGPDGPTAPDLTNHLVLLVHDQRSETNPSGTWYVDAGLGDGPYDPLPFIVGEHPQPAMTYRLELLANSDAGEVHFLHDPRGAFAGMSFKALPTPTMDVFEERHRFLSAADDSPFTRTPTVQHRRNDGVDILRGCTLTRLRTDTAAQETVDTRGAWFDLVTEELRLPLTDVGEEQRGRLWSKVQSAHQSWLDSQS